MTKTNTDTTGFVVTYCPARKASGAFDAAAWATQRRGNAGSPSTGIARKSAKGARAPRR